MKRLLFLVTIIFQLASAQEKRVVGLCAGIVDHSIFITHDSLKKFTSTKNDWQPISYEQMLLLLSNNTSKISAAGSGANVLKGLASLGTPCTIIGQLGDDSMGSFYLEQMDKFGITTKMNRGSLPTGQSLCFITPDGERTMRTYLGSSHEKRTSPLDPSLFKDAHWLHIEGHQFIDKETTISALQLAKEAGLTVSLDLSSISVVNTHKALLLNLLPKYVDVVSCNQIEAKALTGLKPEGAVDFLANLCDIAIVTMSERGSFVKQGENKIHTPAHKLTPIDTTGAGDLFISGFIYGMIHNQSLRQCASIATLTASHIVKVFGTQLQPSSWLEIRSALACE